MKKIISICFMIALALGVKAQKFVPELKVGTVLHCTAFVSGQDFPLTMSIKSLTNGATVGWSVDGYGDGTFVMSQKAVDAGVQLSPVSQPALGETKLPDAETFSIISKAAFKTLTDSKAFNYGGSKFSVKADDKPFKLGDKVADVIHVISEDGKSELWILNNPVLPLLVQTAGLLTDITVNDIK